MRRFRRNKGPLARGLRLVITVTALVTALAAKASEPVGGPAFPAKVASPTGDACSVDLVLAGVEPNVAAIRALVRELLDRHGIEVIASRTTERIDPPTILAHREGHACAYVWIDLRRLDEARLYLTSFDGERVVARRVPLPAGLDELGRESIGQIVESSAVALASGAQVGVPREEAAQLLAATIPAQGPTASVGQSPRDPGGPESRPSPPAVATERSGGLWIPGPASYRLELGYGVEAFLPGPGFEHGPALGSELIWGRNGARLVVGLGAQYSVPVAASTNQVELLFDGVKFRGEIGPELPIDAHDWIAILGGAGLDIVRVQPQRTFDPALAPAPAVVFTTGAARASFVFGRRFSRSFEIAASVFADFPLSHDHFDIAQGATAAPTLTPWSVRPGLCISFNFAPQPPSGREVARRTSHPATAQSFERR